MLPTRTVASPPPPLVTVTFHGPGVALDELGGGLDDSELGDVTGDESGDVIGAVVAETVGAATAEVVLADARVVDAAPVSTLRRGCLEPPVGSAEAIGAPRERACRGCCGAR